MQIEMKDSKDNEPSDESNANSNAALQDEEMREVIEKENKFLSDLQLEAQQHLAKLQNHIIRINTFDKSVAGQFIPAYRKMELKCMNLVEI